MQSGWPDHSGYENPWASAFSGVLLAPLHRIDYLERARQLASALKKSLSLLQRDSLEYVELLPVTFRMFALAGDLQTATALRRDLSGELEATAITLYNRRNYILADKYITHVLEGDNRN